MAWISSVAPNTGTITAATGALNPSQEPDIRT